MPVLSAKSLSKAFGPQLLFEDVSLTVRRGERVGLLGVNGTGKSTLLHVLAGLEPPDTGAVERRRDAQILYLAQEPELATGRTAREIVEEGLAEWKQATTRHADITKRIERDGASPQALDEQAALAERVEHLGGWARGHVVEEMLGHLGVREIDRAVDTFSGGERRRVALARVLVARPALAILDEPTNHLDADTIEWLETYLGDEYEGALLLVTHDRYVLDALCDRIVELDRGRLVEYQGSYGDYLEQKAERLAQEDRVEQNRLNAVRRETAWLRRGAQARTTKQKARIQRAEALIADEPTRAPDTVDLEGLERGASRLSKTVLDLLDVDLAIGGATLARGITLRLAGGDRIGVIGPNGAGKTSLLRVITGELAPAGGKVVHGTSTSIALFDQARAMLRDDWSILDNVAEREDALRTGAGVVTFGDRTIEMRTYLEQFLFDGHKQRQKVGSLSGGERARVALAKVLRSGANLLLLDEPTNDLDVATLAALEGLLESWTGAALVVSHDRWFLDRTATSILAFEGGGKVLLYPGNWSTYRSLRPEPARAAPRPRTPTQPPRKPEAAPAASAGKKLTYAERLELDGMMDAITAAEGRVTAIERELSDPALYTSRAAEAGRLAGELESARAEAARLVARWEELEARRDPSK